MSSFHNSQLFFFLVTSVAISQRSLKSMQRPATPTLQEQIATKQMASNKQLFYVINNWNGNSLDALKHLLAPRADVNAVDEVGRTALHIAALDDNIELANLLLGNPSFTTLDAPDEYGKTALGYAEQNKRLAIASLIKNAKKPNT
jgi:ankyrin repeat protein